MGSVVFVEETWKATMPTVLKSGATAAATIKGRPTAHAGGAKPSTATGVARAPPLGCASQRTKFAQALAHIYMYIYTHMCVCMSCGHASYCACKL